MSNMAAIDTHFRVEWSNHEHLLGKTGRFMRVVRTGLIDWILNPSHKHEKLNDFLWEIDDILHDYLWQDIAVIESIQRACEYNPNFSDNRKYKCEFSLMKFSQIWETLEYMWKQEIDCSDDSLEWLEMFFYSVLNVEDFVLLRDELFSFMADELSQKIKETWVERALELFIGALSRLKPIYQDAIIDFVLWFFEENYPRLYSSVEVEFELFKKKSLATSS